MTRIQAKQRIAQLRKVINHHRYLYHVLDRQEISDAALDSLKHELFLLEQEFPDLVTSTSPTQRVAGTPLDQFKKVRHRQRMLSMEDAFSPEEMRAWEKRLLKLMPPGETLNYYGEVKMDGLAVRLRYTKGTLVLAATRGDGETGEDVTHTIRTIVSVPLELENPLERLTDLEKSDQEFIPRSLARSFWQLVQSGDIEVGGEVIIRKKDFENLNRQQAQRSLALFANPRNLAAGSIRQQDATVAAERHLDFVAWDLLADAGQTEHRQNHLLLRLLGFKVNIEIEQHCVSIDDVLTYQQRVAHERERLPFWVDGIVVGVNSIRAFDRLGVVGKTPRGLIAYKFSAEQATTVVEDIIVQVGRNGTLTPVALLTPVRVAGTTVSRATLHNADEIERLGVRIGDTVVIEKAGDIIPKVLKVLEDMRVGTEKKFHMPKRCPICGSLAERREGQVATTCSNPNCYAMQCQRIIHFASRKAFDIEGLGDKIVEQLLQQGLIKDAASLFDLRVGDLEPLERFAQKKAQNIVDAILARKSISLARFLYALGIPHVGEETARDLAEHFQTVERWSQASKEQIEQIRDIGPVITESTLNWLGSGEHQRYLKRLLKAVTVEPLPKSKTSKQFLGKSFVFTGELETMNREDASELVRVRGGSVSESVSRKTSYVVVGATPGTKAKKAKVLGVSTLSEAEFLKLIQE